ncbi:hypothetical protein BH11BAC7_BH11BAC7_21370 [soil metagenome]
MSKFKAAKNKAKQVGKGLTSGSTWRKAIKEAPSNWSETIAQVVVDGALGIAGGVAGNFLGVWSLAGALPLNIWANKSGHRWLRAASIGMLATGFEDVASSSRTAGFSLNNEMSDGTERVKVYFGQLKRKFGLDKIFGAKTPAQTSEEQTVNGLGTSTIDALDKFEHQIISSGIEHEGSVPRANQNSSSTADSKADFVEAFAVNGLEDLDTPHVI